MLKANPGLYRQDLTFKVPGCPPEASDIRGCTSSCCKAFSNQPQATDEEEPLTKPWLTTHDQKK